MLISHVLMPEQEKNLRKTSHWPAAFAKKHEDDAGATKASVADADEYDSDDSMPAIHRNTNRRGMTDSEESSDSEEEA